jgi:hypothetical protein
MRVAGVAVAAGLLLAVSVFGYRWMMDYSASQSELPLAVAELASDSLASCWGPQGLVKSGDSLRSGERLAVMQGTAKLRFHSGAVVVIESPAVFEPVMPTVMRLEQGTVAVRANGPKNDFLVISPDAAILDLGTSFGVHCTPNDATEVEVFEGAVEVRRDEQASDGQVLGLGAFARIRRYRTGERASAVHPTHRGTPPGTGLPDRRPAGDARTESGPGCWP